MLISLAKVCLILRLGPILTQNSVLLLSFVTKSDYMSLIIGKLYGHFMSQS